MSASHVCGFLQQFFFLTNTDSNAGDMREAEILLLDVEAAYQKKNIHKKKTVTRGTCSGPKYCW
jgi:hypothetical protein